MQRSSKASIARGGVSSCAIVDVVETATVAASITDCVGDVRGGLCCQQCFDGLDQPIGINRLAHIVVHAGFEATLPVSIDRIGGEGNDR